MLTIRIDPQRLEFHHFVISNADGVIFASARQEGRVVNFLIDTAGRWVKQQVRLHFEELPQEVAQGITACANLHYGRIPIYRAPRFDFAVS